MTPRTKQSFYTIVTLSEWMMKHDYDLSDVVTALDEIFGLPMPEATIAYLEEEIEHQAHLFMFVEDSAIIAVAGWRWPRRCDHVEVQFGVRGEFPDPEIRYDLVAEIISRLQRERIDAGHLQVRYALLQYSPYDRRMKRVCLDLHCAPHPKRNTFFKDHLGTDWILKSVLFPLAP